MLNVAYCILAYHPNARADSLLMIARRSGRKPTIITDSKLRSFVNAKPWTVPAAEQEVFTLCFDQGRSISECADRLGISFETVRSYIRSLRLRAARGEHRRARLREPKIQRP